MRDIIFRGKRRDNGEWEYGCLIISPFLENCVMIERLKKKNGYFATPAVNPATVGQYTGLKDMHGKEIFEDDIVRYGENTGVVNYVAGCFCIRIMKKDWFGRNNPAIDIIMNEYPNSIEVIGNIHDQRAGGHEDDHDG